MSLRLRLRYRLYAAFYDLGPGYRAERQRAIELLQLQPGERVLVVGVGTGADLRLLPSTVRTLGVDLSPAMLTRARAHAGPNVELRVMDAGRLELPDGSMDAVLLHQVLEVTTRPVDCLAEAARVVRPGGRVSVFDKFLPDDRPISPWRAAWAATLDLVFTSVKHRFGDLLAAARAPLRVEHAEPAGGPFRVLLLRRGDHPCAPSVPTTGNRGC